MINFIKKMYTGNSFCRTHVPENYFEKLTALLEAYTFTYESTAAPSSVQLRVSARQHLCVTSNSQYSKSRADC